MTLFGRDASHYDGALAFAGLSILTSKATEGTTTRDDTYGAHLNAARAAGVPVLGSYHVVRTPGNGGNGTLAQQLAYWVAWMDSQTPWWRTWPNWILQIDAEHWSYDTVSASTVKQFAALVKGAGLPGWVVTYASKGQYGDTLAGLVTPLWNANYGANTGTYPGDTAAAWAAYSGQVPALLQYASAGYDHDAYRGSLDELKALTAGGTTRAPASEDDMGMIAQDSKSGQHYLCIGYVSYPIADSLLGDLQYLAGQGLFPIATMPPKGNPAEWTADGQIRRDWSPGLFGPVWSPAVAVAMSAADRQAIIDGVSAQVGGKLDQVLARLTAAGDALDG
jgi:hypothetical protein